MIALSRILEKGSVAEEKRDGRWQTSENLFAEAMCSPHGAFLATNVLLTKDEGTASLKHAELPRLGLSALELKSDLFGLLGLLTEDGLRLTTETFLLHVIPALTEGCLMIFAFLVLRNLVNGMLLCLKTEALELLRNVDHVLLAACETKN